MVIYRFLVFITVITDQRHACVDDIICENQRIKQFEIASMLAVSKEHVQAIIADLSYRKLNYHVQ